MSDPTQTGFFFRVGDGASPEVFTQLPGMLESPEFPGDQRTTRPARNVGDSGNTITHKFNQLREGAEFDVPCEHLPGDTVQSILTAAKGQNAGVNMEAGIVGATNTVTYAFTVLVTGNPIQPGNPNDAESVDMITFNLKINSDVTETEAPNT